MTEHPPAAQPRPALHREQIRTRLAARYDPHGQGGDHQVAGLAPESITPVPAAVLIALLDRGRDYTVLLTRRARGLSHHAGQISFPGGRVDPGDRDITAAALREAHEEIGLAPASAEVLGRLTDYRTVTGFLVSPVVALVEPGEYAANPAEVEEIFELPLSFVLDPGNHRRHSRRPGGGPRRRFYALPYGDYYIWGATAAMLVSLAHALQPTGPQHHDRPPRHQR